MTERFELFLFSTEQTFIERAVAAGVDGIIVDWERSGKPERQAGADTQINRDTVDDLRRVRACTDAQVLCRVNPYSATTEAEVSEAIEAGADEILLPMVRSAEEVEAVNRLIRGRCRLGILVETVAGVRSARELSRLPHARVYVGLNDLAIERRDRNIFEAVLDGTVERVRRAFDAPFGFAGLTLPDAGFPIPCRLLIGEMARLGCSFSFLRRSFHRDIRGRDPAAEIPRLRAALEEAGRRRAEDVVRDRLDLETAIRNWPEPLAHIGASPSHG